VIVSKNLGGEGHVTQGSELLVTIQLFNTLNTPIFDVSLADNWAEDFESVTGLTKATWESIPALSTVSHSYIVRPLKSGYTEFSRADVSYRYFKKNYVILLRQ
jgi:translocon-associated protein subunit beta